MAKITRGKTMEKINKAGDKQVGMGLRIWHAGELAAKAMMAPLATAAGMGGVAYAYDGLLGSAAVAAGVSFPIFPLLLGTLGVVIAAGEAVGFGAQGAMKGFERKSTPSKPGFPSVLGVASVVGVEAGLGMAASSASMLGAMGLMGAAVAAPALTPMVLAMGVGAVALGAVGVVGSMAVNLAAIWGNTMVKDKILAGRDHLAEMLHSGAPSAPLSTPSVAQWRKDKQGPVEALPATAPAAKGAKGAGI